MKVEIKTGHFNEWYDKAKGIAMLGDSRKEIELEKSKYTLIMENMDDVNDAYASAFLHRFKPDSFRKYPTFNTPIVDPLYGLDNDNIEKVASGLTKYDEPWLRRQNEGGVDTLGTFSLSNDPTMNIVVFLLLLRLPMEHLAFLSSWTNSKHPFNIRITDDNKIFYEFFELSDKHFRNLVLYAQMSEDDSGLIKRVKNILNSKGHVFFATPKTLNLHNIMLSNDDLNRVKAIPWSEFKVISLNKPHITLSEENITTLNHWQPFKSPRQEVLA